MPYHSLLQYATRRHRPHLRNLSDLVSPCSMREQPAASHTWRWSTTEEPRLGRVGCPPGTESPPMARTMPMVLAAANEVSDAEPCLALWQRDSSAFAAGTVMEGPPHGLLRHT